MILLFPIFPKHNMEYQTPIPTNKYQSKGNYSICPNFVAREKPNQSVLRLNFDELKDNKRKYLIHMI